MRSWGCSALLRGYRFLRRCLMTQLFSSDACALHALLLLVPDSPGAMPGECSGRCLNPCNFPWRKEDYQKKPCYSNEVRECPLFSLLREFRREMLSKLWDRIVGILPHGYEKPGEKKSRLTWMSLVCHGNSVYFTDLNLDSPTSSL